MKKLISISILFIYLILTVVKSVSLHYCHGNLQSVNVLSHTSSCCSTETIPNAGCCQDVVLSVDFDSDQLVAKVQSISKIYPEKHQVLPVFKLGLDILVKADFIKNSTIQVDSSPPKILRLFKLDSSYIFYG
ncbi:MAG: hypothetical protein JXA77_13110 [Bacteroidales bacterium]|nr:hypothetical protein [Bacteroidales bacterium]MBN2821537.1 hypothetical protein [Bacteroidales bacterium]